MSETTPPLQNGIYFGLPFKDYLADPALSVSGIKQLLVSPLTYWVNSPMNPNREEPKPTPAMEFGSALHKLILEGQQAFSKAYAVMPSKDDCPDALDGVEALREKCAELGLKRSGTLLEMSDRILEEDPDAILWPKIMERFRQESEGKTILKADDADHLDRIFEMVRSHPTAKNIFRNGVPEVSIFWTDEDTGIRMKARIDYLRDHAVIDLKSFSNTMEKPLNEAIISAIVGRKYHLQGAVYLDAVEAAKRMAMKGKIFGNPPHEDLLNLAKTTKESRFFFVFCETGKVNNVVVRELAKEIAGVETVAYAAGRAIAERGMEDYARCMAAYGHRPWRDHRQATPIIDLEIPLWAQEI